MGTVEDRIKDQAFLLGASIWECKNRNPEDILPIVMQALIDGLKKASEEEL